jgi:hypothetical protein
MFKVEKEGEDKEDKIEGEINKNSFEKTSDIKAQVLISGFSQKFGVSKFESGINDVKKEKAYNDSSFEDQADWSEEGRL